jgi:hypothetical protein
MGGAAHVSRRSTSAGLSRSDTDDKVPGTNGRHTYVIALDGADIERFLNDLHKRCWLAGLRWFTIGAAGQLLERSIIDRMVGAPERLVFEGAPILVEPLRQSRPRPLAIGRGDVDTERVCAPLTIAETARLRELKEKQAHRLAPESAKARAAFINAQAKRLSKRTGIPEQAAAQTIARQCDGVLLPDVVLPFDDAEFEGCTVADVLADPERFEGATLADPLEGVDYGLQVACIMRQVDGSPFIHSFAHGRTIYKLKLDARAVAAAMEQADKTAAIKTLINLAIHADLDDAELEELRNLAHERTGTNKRTIAAMLKEAQRKQAAQRKQEERKRRLADRRDPRPMISVPLSDAPWLPQMDVLNEVIGSSAAAIPPARDIDGVVTQVLKIAVPDMHAFTDANADQQEKNDDQTAAA